VQQVKEIASIFRLQRQTLKTSGYQATKGCSNLRLPKRSPLEAG
jgi:hypothetical protein